MANWPFPILTAREDIAKELFGFLTAQEMFLIRRTLVSIARRNADSGNATILAEVQETSDPVCRRAIKYRRVDVDRMTGGLRRFDRLYSAIEDTVLAD